MDGGSEAEGAVEEPTNDGPPRWEWKLGDGAEGKWIEYPPHDAAGIEEEVIDKKLELRHQLVDIEGQSERDKLVGLKLSALVLHRDDDCYRLSIATGSFVRRGFGQKLLQC